MPAANWPTESIPDEDDVTRACFDLPAQVDPGSIFRFESDRSGERVESVFWRRHAGSLAELHRRGCELERLKNLRLQSAGKPLKKYSGFRPVAAGSVRQIKSGRQFGFSVTHVPENDDCAHAHVEIVAMPGNNGSKPKANDIRELVELLVARLGPLNGHDCSGKRT